MIAFVPSEVFVLTLRGETYFILIIRYTWCSIEGNYKIMKFMTLFENAWHFSWPDYVRLNSADRSGLGKRLLLETYCFCIDNRACCKTVSKQGTKNVPWTVILICSEHPRLQSNWRGMKQVALGDGKLVMNHLEEDCSREQTRLIYRICRSNWEEVGKGIC